MSMKKSIFLLTVIAIVLSSCSTYQYTARQTDIDKQNIIMTPTVVDVRVDYTKRVNVTSKFCKTQAEALQEARYLAIVEGKIDVVVDPIVKVEKRARRYQVTLTGFAGYYENSRSFYEDVKQLRGVTREEIENYLILHRPEVLQYMNAKGEVININHNGGN